MFGSFNVFPLPAFGRKPSSASIVSKVSKTLSFNDSGARRERSRDVRVVG